MDTDDLYALAPERFVPERNALAKALRGEGKRDQAAAVAALRRPSATAWVVNQLVRGHPERMAELFEAGDVLGRTQRDAIAGHGDRQALHAAGERERAAVATLVDAAGAEYEPTRAVIERVADTLHAAALDDQARAMVREGRLERELRHVGLGVDAGGAVAPGESGAVAERVVARRGEGPRELAEARRVARVAEGEARRRAERATRAAEVAQERRDRAVQALSEAERLLAQSRADAEAAAAAHREARARLEEA